MAGVTDSPSPASVPGPLVGGPSPRPPRSQRRMSPARRLAYGLAAPLLVAALRWLWASCRWAVRGEERLRELGAGGSPCVLTLWHDQVLLGARVFSSLAGDGVRATYLVSPSVDGELGALMLERVRAGVVRGSATRSGVKALHGLYRAMERQGAWPVILPDGPKGPRHESKLGSLLLGQLSGRPVVPLACAARRSWQLPSWDRTIVPRPWTRVAAVVGEPFTVAPGLDPRGLELARLALEQQLEALGAEAARLAAAPDPAA